MFGSLPLLVTNPGHTQFVIQKNNSHKLRVYKSTEAIYLVIIV